MDIDEWCRKMWYSYPNNLCHHRKGDKAKGLKAIEKAIRTDIRENKSGFEEEAQRIERAIEAWIRFCENEKKKTGYTDRWPMASTYYNQRYYNRYIPPSIEIKDNPKKPKIEIFKSEGPAVIDKDKAKQQIQSIRSVLK